jgi:hypothetical protein
VESTNHPASQVDRLWTQLRELYDTREIIDAANDEQSGRYGIGVLFWRGDDDLARWRSRRPVEAEQA